MQYYISRTHVSLDGAGRLSGYETVLTKPSTFKRFSSMGIDCLHVCEHPANSRRWGKLDRAQTKRTKTRALTMADVAEDIAELEREAKKTNDGS